MHEGLRIILVVVSLSSCHYALQDALHFVWILWRINFFATKEKLYSGFYGWFNKVRSSSMYALRVSEVSNGMEGCVDI